MGAAGQGGAAGADLYGWGYAGGDENGGSQHRGNPLGLGNITAPYSTPVQIGSNEFLAAYAGHLHSHFIQTDGTLWATGKNDGTSLWNLGIGGGSSNENIQATSPVQVGSDTNWTNSQWSEAQKTTHIVKKEDGTWWGWGKGDYWAIQGANGPTLANGNTPPDGINSLAHHYEPTLMWGGDTTTWSSINTDGAGRCHFGVKNDGTLWGWGANGHDRLGTGASSHNLKSSPVQVGASHGMSSWTWLKAFSNTNNQSIGLRSDGTLWSWGLATSNNWDSWLCVNGNTTFGNASVQNHPKQVPGTGSGYVDLRANGRGTAWALKSDGTLMCWGSHGYRYVRGDGVGSGSPRGISTPIQIGSTGEWEKFPSTVGVGNSQTMGMIKKNGTIWMWGEAKYSQTGVGTGYNIHTQVPTQVGSDTDWASMSLGDGHTLALKAI